MCIQNASNYHTWTFTTGGAIKKCLSDRLESISFDDCEIAAHQLFSTPGINEAAGICIDHFISDISVERCFEASDQLFFRQPDKRKMQCLEANLINIDFHQCTELANQIGSRAHRVCAELIPTEGTLNEETSQDVIAQ